MCRECGARYPDDLIHVCGRCFGPLEVVYNLDKTSLSRAKISGRPKNLWRYRELLPIKRDESIIDLGTGYTPLHSGRRLGDHLGLRNLYLKDDTVNPTNSFKDRPSSVAISKAMEFKARAVGCPSTGNLAAAVAAHAAKAGVPCYIFVPADTEKTKILQAVTYGANLVAVDGTYDEANRLAAQVAEKYGWAFANVNLRPYYVEGSKTLAYEVCEQLGWRAPDSIVVPLGSGALMLAIKRGFEQFMELGLIEEKPVRLIGAQAEGCAPIVNAFKEASEDVTPIEHPRTIAKSLAIGDPGDGFYVLKAIRESGGVAESAADEDILSSIRLLASKEGVFSEPAGGVTVAALRKLVEQGLVSADETVVCCVTGNGFKAADTIEKSLPDPTFIEPTLGAFAGIVGI